MQDTSLDRKVVLIGATDVGKTSITTRYCFNSFSTTTSATVGALFVQKRVAVGPHKRRISLHLWDTAGQERFRSMAPMYFRNAHAAILVFDLTSEASFVKAQEWLQALREYVTDDIVLALVGNKSDCETSFDFTIAERFAEDIGAMTFRTSAKTGDGIEQLFTTLGERLLAKHEADERKRARDHGAMGGLADSMLWSFSRHGEDRLVLEKEDVEVSCRCCH